QISSPARSSARGNEACFAISAPKKTRYRGPGGAVALERQQAEDHDSYEAAKGVRASGAVIVVIDDRRALTVIAVVGAVHDHSATFLHFQSPNRPCRP